MELIYVAAAIMMGLGGMGAAIGVGTVSYTHLTLPTKA